jgi:hypothetical protein
MPVSTLRPPLPALRRLPDQDSAGIFLRNGTFAGWCERSRITVLRGIGPNTPLTICNMVAWSALRRGSQVMRMSQWRVEAAPILETLMDAGDRVLTATNRVMLTACCDQLDAAAWDSDGWLRDNQCPDRR